LIDTDPGSRGADASPLTAKRSLASRTSTKVYRRSA